MKTMILPSNVLKLIGILFPLGNEKRSSVVSNLFFKRAEEVNPKHELVKVSQGSEPNKLQLEFLMHGKRHDGNTVTIFMRRSKVIGSESVKSSERYYELDLSGLKRGIYELLVFNEEGHHDRFEVIKLH